MLSEIKQQESIFDILDDIEQHAQAMQEAQELELTFEDYCKIMYPDVEELL